MSLNTKDVLALGARYLKQLPGHKFAVLSVARPVSPEAAVNLARVVSKLSPLLGNLIEFNTVEILNEKPEFTDVGKWERQDPGFPDTVFRGVDPLPGFEIKAWFPLATEITARFKDSQNRFIDDNTHVAMIAWLPDRLIYGTPKIIDVCVVSGLSVAKARDDHYHNPPHYLVLEPEDTSARTINLQQSNTAGYCWQGSTAHLEEAQALVETWGPDGRHYKPTPDYQQKLRELTARYTYRLDTNYAKMDRIVHVEIEEFKDKVLNTEVHGMTVRQWARLISRDLKEELATALRDRLGVKEENADELLR